MSSKIRIKFVNRPVPYNGPFDSIDFNASMEEASLDFITMAAHWNDELYPLLSTLPQGAVEDRWVGATNVPDPVEDGLDGRSIFVDLEAADTVDDGNFWSDTDDRPLTLKEMFQNLLTSIATLSDAVEEQAEAQQSEATVTRQTFSAHTDGNTPIVVNHNIGRYPLVQVIDTTVAGVEGAAIDEVYTYESEQSLPASSAFVNISHVSVNTVNVYTNATSGVIVVVG